jgi:hypothetical protein
MKTRGEPDLEIINIYSHENHVINRRDILHGRVYHMNGYEAYLGLKNPKS